MARARRLPFAKIVLAVVGALISRPAAAQQLGSTFTLDDQQTAVTRLAPGQFVRVRLKDGTRAGGPLIRATPLAFTVGPSVAFGDQDSVLRLRSVDSLWVRVYSTRRGTAIGGVLGGALGLAIGLTSASICPVDGFTKPCAQGAATSAAAGVVVGALAGSLAGSARSHWRRVLPQGATHGPTDLAIATLTGPSDSIAFDRRALALMRIPRGSQIRLTFGDRGDLAGYLLRAGAGGATVGVLVGHPGDAAIAMASLEGIWERGTAQRTGSTVGLLLGSLAGVAIATQSSACDPHNSCRTSIVADGVLVGVVGYFLGGRVGRWFPQWHRRY